MGAVSTGLAGVVVVVGAVGSVVVGVVGTGFVGLVVVVGVLGLVLIIVQLNLGYWLTTVFCWVFELVL